MKAKRNGATALEQVVEDTDNLARLVDQVVEGHTPIVVARDGEPKAALVSMEDYARLKQATAEGEQKLSWDEWLREARDLHKDILSSRANQPIDLDQAVREMRDDLEERDAYHRGT